jgi:hypothetical protein
MQYLSHGTKSILFVLALAGSLPATTINYNPAPTTTAGWSTCANFARHHCKTIAYFDPQALSDENNAGVSNLFQLAFDAWNDTAGGQGWTDSMSPTDLGGSFDVTVAKAEQFDGNKNVVNDNVVFGGLEIRVTLNNVKLPALGPDDQLVWVQGLLDNYPSAGGVASTYELDIFHGIFCTLSGPAPYCPPAYPEQYADNHFYDQPKARYREPGTTQAFFDANAYLAVENYETKTLTLYDGISYGFQNYVSPEPGAWVLVGSGLIIGLLYRRHAYGRS